MGNNSIIGNLESYQIIIDPNDFDGIGFDVTLESNSLPYRPQDGIIKAACCYLSSAHSWGRVTNNETYSTSITI